MDYSTFFSQGEGAYQKTGKKDLDYLKSKKYPDCFIELYKHNEPQGCVEINGVRLCSISHLRVENKDGVPGYIIYPYGFRAVGTTIYGDLYCLNINQLNKDGQPVIFMANHEEISEDEEFEDEEDCTSSMVKVADSLDEFLERFINGTLDSQADSGASTNTQKPDYCVKEARLPSEQEKQRQSNNVFYRLGHDDAYPDVWYNSKKDHFYGVKCPVFSGHSRAGRNDENLSIVIKRKKMGDFVYTAFCDWLITDKTAEIFEKEGLTGYKLREVDVANKVLPFKLLEIIVLGKAQIHPDSGVREIYRCEHCDLVMHRAFNDSTGIIIDENSWDGSDFFMMEVYGYVFVTERVKKVIEEHKLTGVELTPSTELRYGDFVKFDQDWTKEQWKEYFENEGEEE